MVDFLNHNFDAHNLSKPRTITRKIIEINAIDHPSTSSIRAFTTISWYFILSFGWLRSIGQFSSKQAHDGRRQYLPLLISGISFPTDDRVASSTERSLFRTVRLAILDRLANSLDSPDLPALLRPQPNRLWLCQLSTSATIKYNVSARPTSASRPTLDCTGLGYHSPISRLQRLGQPLIVSG